MKPWFACCLVFAGCGARFVEPHPPELSRVTQALETTAQVEPLVFVFVWDVHLSSLEECTTAREQWAAQVRSAMHAAKEAPRVELAEVDLAAGCQQSADRRLDLSTLEHAWFEAERQFPNARVRPLVVYLNNVNLRLPEGLHQDFVALSERADARGSLRPALWGLTAPAAATDLFFDWRTDWTYVGDEALPKRLKAQAERALPWMSTRPAGTPVPLLTAEALRTARYLRTCQWDPRALPVGFVPNGRPHPVSAEAPPAYVLSLPERWAVPRDTLEEEALQLQVEVCADYCDRHAELDNGDFVHWMTSPRCVLPGEPEPAR